MSFVKAQFFAIALLVTLSGGLSTIGFFFDIEGQEANVFRATLLDQDVAGQPIDGLLCDEVDRVSTTLYAGNLGELAFNYGFRVENATGTICGDLSVELVHGTSSLYDGPLLGLDVSGISLSPEMADELFLELRFSAGASSTGSCQFDTSWFAEQLEGEEGPGFSDVEMITHVVTGSAIGYGAGCVPPEPSVNLHMSKAISGVDLGYELSDFSYRITGEGIDIIAPHDSYTPLPVGIYTIEELVPEGFVKADWRIGWYGQCEKGDTFFTTIEIEERHLDWGTLYCQADNQYRPELNTTEEEEIVAGADTAESLSRRTGRTGRGDTNENESSSTEVTATSTATTTTTVEVTETNTGSITEGPAEEQSESESEEENQILEEDEPEEVVEPEPEPEPEPEGEEVEEGAV